MGMLITTSARAYVNHGRWVADCPRAHCGNAMALTPGQALFECGGVGGCGMVAEVVWPPDADAIWEALAERPVPATRNWYPSGHTIAERAGIPHGQSAAELRAEAAAHGEVA